MGPTLTRILLAVSVLLGIFLILPLYITPQLTFAIFTPPESINQSQPSNNEIDKDATLLPLQQPLNWSSICAAHGKAVKPVPRKVYDCFTLNKELDMLEIRLNELANVVHKFVIAESAITFTGHPKPLSLKDNWNNFERFHNQISHLVLTAEQQNHLDGPWQREIWQRNQLFVHARRLPDINEGDILLISDVDEIPRPEALYLISHCEYPEAMTLLGNMFYYSFEYLMTTTWNHPQYMTHSPSKSNSADDVRMNNKLPTLSNASWHCSCCFAKINDFVNKIESFSHKEYNTEKVKSRENIISSVKNGLDYLGRQSSWTILPNNQDVPKYLLANAQKFSYMLHRYQKQDAGFIGE